MGVRSYRYALEIVRVWFQATIIEYRNKVSLILLLVKGLAFNF